jgi:hypothetical protein
MSTPWDRQSFIVWIMVGMAERDTARRAMRRWSAPRAMVMTFAFFVPQPMKMGRRRSSVCQPSAMKEVSLAGLSREDDDWICIWTTAALSHYACAVHIAGHAMAKRGGKGTHPKRGWRLLVLERILVGQETFPRPMGQGPSAGNIGDPCRERTSRTSGCFLLVSLARDWRERTSKRAGDGG